jgi:hypothetical protein
MIVEDETKPAISPRIGFDWPIYADATLAGLATLIPLPLIDLFFEWLFRRRMPGAIARRNGRQLPPQAIQRLNRGRFGCWPGCFMWPVTLVIQFIKRLYRTVLYFLTVKAAADRLSYYWHRAFLLDYMIRRGDLDDAAQAELATAALEQVLAHTAASPITQLAQQIVSGTSHALRAAWRWLRRREDAAVDAARETMARSWTDFSGYLAQTAQAYETTLRELQAKQTADIPAPLPDGGRPTADRPAGE